MVMTYKAHGGRDMARLSLDWDGGQIVGLGVKQSEKLLGELKSIFHDREAQAKLDPKQRIYQVQWLAPVEAGSEGGLFWGVTILEPGKVGDEYFMTHGHFHANRTRAEYYTTVRGEGSLIRMDESRHTWSEPMTPGTLHYIDGRHAHRVANTGTVPLVFWACWAADAGYDYGTIAEHGFGARLVDQKGMPVLVPND